MGFEGRTTSNEKDGKEGKEGNGDGSAHHDKDSTQSNEGRNV